MPKEKMPEAALQGGPSEAPLHKAAASFPRQTLFLAQGIAALDFPPHARLPAAGRLPDAG